MPTPSSFAHQVPTILPLRHRVAEALRILRSGTTTPNNTDQAEQTEQSNPTVARQSDEIEDVRSTDVAANLRGSREATERLVQHGWNLGQVPYVYQPVPVTQGRHTRVRLVPDLPAARAVTIIFHDYVHCQRGLAEIRDHMVRAGYPAPVLRRTGRKRGPPAL